MLLKTVQTPEERERNLVYIGSASQFAFVAGILLSRLDINGLDFLEGMLIGFSIVGNLAYLVYTNRKRSKK